MFTIEVRKHLKPKTCLRSKESSPNNAMFVHSSCAAWNNFCRCVSRCYWLHSEQRARRIVAFAGAVLFRWQVSPRIQETPTWYVQSLGILVFPYSPEINLFGSILTAGWILALRGSMKHQFCLTRNEVMFKLFASKKIIEHLWAVWWYCFLRLLLMFTDSGRIRCKSFYEWNIISDSYLDGGFKFWYFLFLFDDII